MACIDANGNITRSAELILLALMEPSSIEAVVMESGLPLFRVRSAVRELSKAGLLKAVADEFQITSKGVERLEFHIEKRH